MRKVDSRALVLQQKSNIWRLLADHLNQLDSQDVSIQDMLKMLQGRAYGLGLILFAIPNCIPLPPFVSSVFGVPLLLFAAQMTVGQDRPRLPAIIGRQRFDKSFLIKGLAKLQKVLQRLEKLCRGRLALLSGAVGQRLLGVFLVPLALAVMVPLPLTNFLPALIMIVVGFGLLHRDGVVILAGIAGGVIAIAVVFPLVFRVVVPMLGRLFGYLGGLF